MGTLQHPSIKIRVFLLKSLIPYFPRKIVFFIGKSIFLLKVDVAFHAMEKCLEAGRFSSSGHLLATPSPPLPPRGIFKSFEQKTFSS